MTDKLRNPHERIDLVKGVLKRLTVLVADLIEEMAVLDARVRLLEEASDE